MRSIGSERGRHATTRVTHLRRWWALAVVTLLVAAGGVLALALTPQATLRAAGPGPAAIRATDGPSPAIAPVAAAPGPATTLTAHEREQCPAGASACVDLGTRTAWLQDHGQLSFGPVPVLAGAQTGLAPPGPTSSATPTGAFHVLRKKADDFSSEFHEPMPDAVYFAPGGIAFHEGSLVTASNGCVHLDASASTAFFERLRVGDPVDVFS